MGLHKSSWKFELGQHSSSDPSFQAISDSPVLSSLQTTVLVNLKRASLVLKPDWEQHSDI